MALRNLVEAQCGEGNPLLSLTHHLTRDKAHKEDTHFSAPHHDAVENYKIPYGGPVSPDQLAEEFMNETRNAATTSPQAFRMDTLLQEMQAIERVPPMLGPAVADLASEAGTWYKEYLDSETSVQGRTNENNLINELGLSAQPKHWFLEAEAQWNQASSEVSNQSEAAKWVQEYNPQEDSELAKTANEILGTVEDPKFSNTEFMKYIRTLGKGGQNESAQGWQDEFLSSPQMLESNFWSREFTDENPIAVDSWGAEFLKEIANSREAPFKPQEWQKEFDEAQRKGTFDDVVVDSDAMSEKEREDFWQKWQEDWNKAAKDDGGAHPWLTDFEADYSEPFKEYAFQEENPLKDHPNPLSEGKKCLAMGDIPSAVLFFEAAVQQDPESGEAWLLLGTTHAENEQDPSAIPALKRGVEIDDSNLKGWMALATSYTNESYQNYACFALQEWIRNNAEYRHLISPNKTFPNPKSSVASLASRDQISEVQSLYLRAANSRPSAQIDGDVQCGLGILLNLTGDYERAVDCFQSALQSKPSDPELWNKLGATLANSNRSAEAVEAYRNCLEISPGFIRCRYNLGIACINLGAHKDAMEHFLEALNMQEKSRGTGSRGSSLAVSDNIWSTVRICLKHLDAQHLMNAVHNRDLKKLNQEFGAGSSS